MQIFDEMIDRRGTGCIKCDFIKEYGKPEDILPLWVADMDFKAPEEVSKALKKVAEFGIYGYSSKKEDYDHAVLDWFCNRFGWQAKKEWIVITPGVVFALNTAVEAYTEPGEAVMIMQPVYYPFSAAVKNHGRKLINCQLMVKNDHYEIDFDNFEKLIEKEQVKMFILCSPHNPVGRVWTKEELLKIHEICLKHRVLVVSDEIHCDFVYSGHRHTVFASLSEEAQNNCIVCTAPSKTFNLAGLQVSNIFIPNDELRQKFEEARLKTGYGGPNIFAIAGCTAAYRYGADWLDELLLYLSENRTYMDQFLKEKLPMLKLMDTQGTYLVWMDCSGLGMSDEELEYFMVNNAKLWLDGGSMFSPLSGQFERINIACPRETIQKAMEQLYKAAAEAGICE